MGAQAGHAWQSEASPRTACACDNPVDGNMSRRAGSPGCHSVFMWHSACLVALVSKDLPSFRLPLLSELAAPNRERCPFWCIAFSWQQTQQSIRVRSLGIRAHRKVPPDVGAFEATWSKLRLIQCYTTRCIHAPNVPTLRITDTKFCTRARQWMHLVQPNMRRHASLQLRHGKWNNAIRQAQETNVWLCSIKKHPVI